MQIFRWLTAASADGRVTSGRTSHGSAYRRKRGARGGVVLVGAVVAAVLLAGCGAGDDEGATPTPGSPSPSQPASSQPSVSPSPVDAVALAEQAAIAAYEGMWAAYDAAGSAPQADPDDPGLAEFAQGRALDVLSSGLESLRDRGAVIEGEVVLNPEVVELSPPDDPSEVEIEDCGDSTDWLTVDAETGEVSDEPRGRQLVFATVRDFDGEWKVVDFAVREVGSCG